MCNWGHEKAYIWFPWPWICCYEYSKRCAGIPVLAKCTSNDHWKCIESGLSLWPVIGWVANCQSRSSQEGDDANEAVNWQVAMCQGDGRRKLGRLARGKRAAGRCGKSNCKLKFEGTSSSGSGPISRRKTRLLVSRLRVISRRKRLFSTGFPTRLMGPFRSFPAGNSSI